MRILYTGPLRRGSVTEGRYRALLGLGHDVSVLDQSPYFYCGSRLLMKSQMHLLVGPGITAYNRDIVARARATRPALIYIDAGSYLRAHTVAALRETGALVVHYTSEYFGFRPYWYRQFTRAIRLYDVHVITNPLNASFLRRRGAKRIVMTRFGFDPEVHRPPSLSAGDLERYGSEAVFVGHWEPSTERMILALRKAKIEVRVWGRRWSQARSLGDRVRIRSVPAGEYIKVLSCAKLCLCFLSRWNHNQAAGRTFEIPAVGGFLLAERTSEHASYFEEGREAEFFGSEEELIAKAREYRADDAKRGAVARAGHHRCMNSAYTHHDRVRQLLEDIG